MTTHILIADIATDVAVGELYSWRVPDGMRVGEGAIVAVPFGKAEALGIVWALRQVSPEEARALKCILSSSPLPPIPKSQRDFIDTMVSWTLSRRGMVVRMVLRGVEEAANLPPSFALRLKDAARVTRLTPARAKVLAALEHGTTLSKAALAKLAGCSAGVINALLDEGALESVALAPENYFAKPEVDFTTVTLEDGQAAVLAKLRENHAPHKFTVSVLEGVSGSGKTEVYCELIVDTIRRGEQVLVLMPEIALTTQSLTRFEKRFGVVPPAWHGSISAKERGALYASVGLTRDDKAAVPLIVGARSALFLPFAKLGLIIVDEEHDPGFKHRDMAVLRARFAGCPIVLASATPAIETKVNVAAGKYAHVMLPERHGGRAMPLLTAIDLRANPPDTGRTLSPVLLAALQENLDKGEQSLLFLNRRGFAPLTVCRACGEQQRCPHCAASLVEHRFRRALVCHLCGHTAPRLPYCASCGVTDQMVALGPGIERLGEELAEALPQARIKLVSSDMAGGVKAVQQSFQDIAEGKCDIIVGTQLVAKGHNFPHCTLVGVVDADSGLGFGASMTDPRAAERSFQLLQQVTGRAGRGDKPGRGLVQSFQPNHPVIEALVMGDTAAFYTAEISERQKYGLPPFGRMVALIVTARQREAALAHARALVKAAMSLPDTPAYQQVKSGALPAPEHVQMWGPAEAPIARIRGRWRYRLLVKAPRAANVQHYVRDVLAAAPSPRAGVRVIVDVDPYSFL